jgi:hypothetical protein
LGSIPSYGTLPTLSISRSGIKNLRAFEKVTALFKLELAENWQLESLEGLDNLESVSGDQGSSLHVVVNPKLTSLHGLEKLSHSNADIQVDANELLTDFCGLKTLFTNSNPDLSFYVERNAINPTKEEIVSSCP